MFAEELGPGKATRSNRPVVEGLKMRATLGFSNLTSKASSVTTTWNHLADLEVFAGVTSH